MFNKKLLSLIGKNYRYIIYAVITMIINLLCNILITFSICWIIDMAMKHTEFISYLIPSSLIIFGIILKYFCNSWLVIIKNKLAEVIKGKLRTQLFIKVSEIGQRPKDPLLGKASITQLSIEGIEQLDLYYSVYLPQLFYSLIAPLILFTIVVFLNWQVALVLLVCVPLIPASIIAVSKYAKKVFAKYWGKYIYMGEGFLDNIRGLRELKIFNTDKIQQTKMNKESEEFRVITMKVLIMQLASVTIMDLIAYGGAAAGIILTLTNLLDANINIPIGLFIMLIAIEFFIPLRTLGSGFHIAMNGISAGKKILEIMEIPSPKWGNKKINNNTLNIKNLDFGYSNETHVLKNINMQFKPNAINAIVGQSGSGKSTLVNLLAGLIRTDKGELYIGDHEIKDINKNNFYKHVGLVGYNSYIFNISILENFRLAKSKITEKEIWELLRKVNLDHFIKHLGGLNYLITEDANNLSGGQKQRLSLAINLASQKGIYIFDEATSNIDLHSENIIMKNIYDLKDNATIILISHRLVNIKQADNIFFLEKGAIIASGTHQKLLKKCVQYKKLFDHQHKLETTFEIGRQEYHYEY